MTPSEAVALVENGFKIFVHGAAATPTPLLNALCDRSDLEGVKLYHLHLTGECRFARPEYTDRLYSVSLFTGPAMRGPVNDGYADFVPVFLSDIPGLFSSKRIPLDVALVQLSPPDRRGVCSLGTSVDTARAAVDSARLVIAEINEQVPRTHGYSSVHLSQIDAFIHTDRSLFAHEPAPPTSVERKIGAIIAALIPDGATLQMGIGAIPDAVLSNLHDKVDLGVHTEMFSDGVIDLTDGGVITNRLKAVHAGRTTTSFVSGSRRLYDFVDDNLGVEFHPCNRTNDTKLIRQNPRVIAMNSALQIDLTGQICADSLGHRIYSGIGGQMDFMRGAALSEGGKAIIAIPATAAKGQVSRISLALTPGAGVVTTRGHVHWVVTEYGAVNLHGLGLKQRGDALISIAHPDFRSGLTRDLYELRHYPLS